MVIMFWWWCYIISCACLCYLMMFMINDGYHVLDWWWLMMYDVIITCVECCMLLWCACIYILVELIPIVWNLTCIANNRSMVMMGGEAGFMSRWLWTNRCWWLSSRFGTTCIESCIAFCMDYNLIGWFLVL